MNIGYALNRGLHFGAMVGGIAACVGLLFAVGMATNGVGFGLAQYLFGAGAVNAVTNALTAAALEFVGGTLAGAVAGGTLFTATHVVTHAIPGLPEFLGDTTPSAHMQRRHRHITSEIGNARTRQFDESRFDANDRNTGFRRMIEEQQARESQQDMGR